MFAGTPRYTAPEQMFGERAAKPPIVCLGTMLYEALTGELPYRGTAAELLLKKREEDPPPTCASGRSPRRPGRFNGSAAAPRPRSAP